MYKVEYQVGENFELFEFSELPQAREKYKKLVYSHSKKLLDSGYVWDDRYDIDECALAYSLVSCDDVSINLCGETQDEKNLLNAECQSKSGIGAKYRERDKKIQDDKSWKEILDSISDMQKIISEQKKALHQLMVVNQKLSSL